jgi:hypothetical protein
MDFLQFAFQSFWHFVGVLILVAIPFNTLVAVIRAFSDWMNINKHGWNPYSKTEKNKDEDILND